ncbi:hypothetical protein DASC09_051620 [Saccharomycopsis crataegensis]|uniref:Glutathione peroxidase n=1 Tax=Saccharomycopsis crataegensis TaxID=43959 RepID=A0AAV5QTV3_9ASCO|nr:hypothetical protein DASC09_051620 [Saccharomycopsis crataegensis]
MISRSPTVVAYKNNRILPPSFSSSPSPLDNQFTFQSASSPTTPTTPETSIFTFQRPIASKSHHDEQVQRESVLERDLEDIIDGYANDNSFDTKYSTSTVDVRTRAPMSTTKRARRQSSVYQDTISIISKDEDNDFTFDTDFYPDDDIVERKRKLITISKDPDLASVLSRDTINTQQQSIPQDPEANDTLPDLQTFGNVNRSYQNRHSVMSVAMAEPNCMVNNSRAGYSTTSFASHNHFITNGIRPSQSAQYNIGSDFYKLSADDIYGNHFEFSELRDKVVLVVNVSFHGSLAAKNFKLLNYLHNKYHSQGLVVIGFPCYQFNLKKKNVITDYSSMKMTPIHKRSVSLSDLATIAENQRQIAASASMNSIPVHSRSVSNNAVSMFSTSPYYKPRSNSVNSPSSSAISSIEQVLTKYNIQFPVFTEVKVNGKHSHDIYQHLKSDKKGLLGTSFIKWNFEKFLVDRYGNVARRYSWLKNGDGIEEVVKYLLDESQVVVDNCRPIVGFNSGMFS